MKKKIFSGILIYIAIFILFFIIRLLYGIVEKEGVSVYYSNYYNPYYPRSVLADRSERENINEGQKTEVLKNIKSNFASYKRTIQKEITGEKPQIIRVDQKYEKIATLTTETRDFDKSDKELRESIKKYNSVIQYENNTGLKGSRFLDISIGVPPDNFDTMVEEVKKIGILRSIEINKIDKTSEFKDINAQKKSLENTLDSLILLRSKGGKLSEEIDLEYKIQEIEKQLQELGVRLGDYSEENELCTLKISLYENTYRESFSIAKLIMTAFLWSVKYYFYTTVMVFLASLITLIILAIIDKFKVLQAIMGTKSGRK